MNTHSAAIQPKWQRILLLAILLYEGLGGILGGALLVSAPDGSLMDLPVSILNGFFPGFLIPGLILLGMGILTTISFFLVLRQSRFNWHLDSPAFNPPDITL